MDEIQKLGEILNNENQNFPKYYNSENREKLSQVWGEKKQDLELQEEELKPLTEHQKEAQSWLEAWQGILPYCKDLESFKGLMTVMDTQSERFADFPEIVKKVRCSCEQKLRELESRMRIDF